MQPWHRLIKRFIQVGALALMLAALGGCASVYLVDNQVRSYATWEAERLPAVGDAFRFERLPSQGDGSSPASQRLEPPVQQALEQWGLKAVTGSSQPVRWTVQLSAQGLRYPRAPWDDPPRGMWGGHGGIFISNGQVAFMPMLSMRFDTPYYEREITIVMRDARNGRVVYETRARHDGRWHDSPALWAAMAQAALRDFPQPPSGVRQVNIEVPR